jgi:nucleotidyltransferase/DNA polymerase involved in DNA repair
MGVSFWKNFVVGLFDLFIYLFFLPSFTLDVEAVSCDEMFVDCTGVLQHTCTSPMQFASFLRQEIEVH